MWKKIQANLRKYRLKFGKYLWDRKKKKEKINRGNFIENNDIKSILFLRQDGKAGDMVVSTLIFQSIKKKYPHIKVAVITRGAGRDIIENNPNIDKIYDFKKEKKEIKKLAARISEEKYDLLVDFSNMLRVRDMRLISLCKAKYNIGVNREDWEIFDININFSFQSHITDLYTTFLKKIGIFEIEMHYHLGSFNSFEKKNEYILLNPYAASEHRSFSRNTVLRIGKEIVKFFPNKKIYILGQKENEVDLSFFQDKLGEVCEIVKTKSIHEVFPFVKNAEFVITPDTSIVHIAVAFDKNMITVYREDKEGDYNSKVWGANSKRAERIYSQTEDINLFSWDIFREKLKKMMKERVWEENF